MNDNEDLFDIDLGSKSVKKIYKKQTKEEDEKIIIKVEVDYYLNYIQPIFKKANLELEISKKDPVTETLKKEIHRKHHSDIDFSFIKILKYQHCKEFYKKNNDTFLGYI